MGRPGDDRGDGWGYRELAAIAELSELRAYAARTGWTIAISLDSVLYSFDRGESAEACSNRSKSTARLPSIFDKNYVTKGMEILLSQRLKRLAGKSDQAVFELKQAMGGGKTHSMIAFGLLAKNPALRTAVVPGIASDAGADAAKLVAVNGRLGFEETFIWGEIAAQLGRRPVLQILERRR